LVKGDYGHIRTMNQKSALNQLIAGGVVFLLIWASIDDIFFLIPKGDTYGEGKYVVLFLALVKVFDIATGLNTEIIVYSKFFRFATLFIVASAIFGFLLNLWLIPINGFLGAAIATAATTLVYSIARMTFVWNKFGVLPFTNKTLQVALILAVLYALTFLMPDYNRTILSAMLMMALRSFVIILLFTLFIVRFKVSEEINGLVTGLQNRFLK
jgi:O-antigen/teichoic acid export membrane protein